MILLLACYAPSPKEAPPDGALGLGASNPFPSVELVRQDALFLDEQDLPATEVQWDVARLNRRAGFSVVQTSVVQFPEPVDAGSIGGQDAMGYGGSVQMVDLTTGEEIPVLVELDQNEDAAANPSLLVRPMRAMTVGHDVAVVVTAGVTQNGGPIALPEPEGHYAELHAALAQLGFAEVQLAWDFPVGSGTDTLDAMLGQIEAPTAWTLTDVEVGDEAPVAALMQAEGTYTVTNFLVDDALLEVTDAGVVAQGTAEAYLFVHVPASVADAAPGTVPVIVFGHGIFGNPKQYWADPDNLHQLAIADELGAIVVGTLWRGLNSEDYLHTVEVAGDFPRIEEVTDRLQQSVVNVTQLIALVQEGGLFSDPAFATIQDKVDPDATWYFGISLGGIEGAVTLANTDRVERGVLHVGGAYWSTMLERSVQWPPFAAIVTQDYTDAHERQVAYAASQLFWDPVDPANHAERLVGRDLLWQEAMEDDQVPNLTTELLMRSVGVPLATPAATAPFDIETVAMPVSGAAFTQFDPLTDASTTTNVPGVVTSAHSIPRTWPGMQRQTATFLRTGEVLHYCGTEVCSADNTGE
jgi:hypothetical protein